MAMVDFEVEDPNEMREEMLLQLLAVFVRRFGGEVVLSKREFSMVEGLPLLAHHVTPTDLKLRLVEEHEMCDDCGDIHLDDSAPES